MGELGRSLNGLMASHLARSRRRQDGNLADVRQAGEQPGRSGEGRGSEPHVRRVCRAPVPRFHVSACAYGTIEYDHPLFPAIADKARSQSPDPILRPNRAIALYEPGRGPFDHQQPDRRTRNEEAHRARADVPARSTAFPQDDGQPPWRPPRSPPRCAMPATICSAANAYAQAAENALPTYFIEINYRDQVDLGDVFVAPGLATYTNLMRGENGRKAAMFYQQAELTLRPNDVYLTPESMVLDPHLDNIAMIDTCELTPGRDPLPPSGQPHAHPGLRLRSRRRARSRCTATTPSRTSRKAARSSSARCRRRRRCTTTCRRT